MDRYEKPMIKVKKVKINLFLSSRYKDSRSFPIGQVFAQSGNCSIVPPGTGDGGLVCSSSCTCVGGDTCNCF